MRAPRNVPLLRVLLALSLVLSACTLASPAATPTPTATSATAYATVEQAYRVLLEQHVDKPSSKTLLDGAAAQVQELVARPAQASPAPSPSPATPAFSGDSNRDLAQFAVYLDQMRAQAPTLQQVDLERAAIHGMTRALNECHTYYLDPERARNFQAAPSRYGGIGALIAQPSGAGGDDALPEIASVFLASPAERVGLKPGDRIKSVDGKSVAGLTTQEVANVIKGPEGTQVTLIVVRAAEERTFVITRGNILPPVIYERGVTDGIGRVDVPGQILADSPRQLLDALKRLDEKGAKAFVVDLRANQGGLLSESQLIASIFIKDGVIAYQVGRDGKEQPLAVQQKFFFASPKPLVVLVNRFTGSGAEIVTSAIQEHRAGRIVGEKTAGCVGSAQQREMPDGGLLLVTVTRMLSGVQKKELNTVGITPDTDAPDDPDTAQDETLAAAIAWLRTQVRVR